MEDPAAGSADPAASSPALPATSPEPLQQALTAAGVGTWRYEAATRTFNLSPVAASLLGQDSGEGEYSLDALATRIPPADRASLVAGWARLVGTEVAQTLDFRVVEADGTTRWVGATGAPPAGTAATGGSTAATGVMFDITDRVRANQALAESEERNRLSVEVARLGTWRREMRTGRFHYSPLMAEILGLPAVEFDEDAAAGMNRVHPDDRTALFNETVRDRAAGEPLLSEFRIVRPDGAVRWLQAHHRLVDAAGANRVVISAARDITEERSAVAALAESEAQLRAMFEHSRGLIMMLAPDGVILRVNRGYLHSVPPAGPYVAGRNLFDYLAPVQASALRESLDRALRGEAHTVEVRGAGPHNEWLEMNFSPVTGEGGPPKAVAVFVYDMTEQIHSEQALMEVQRSESVGRLVAGVAHDFNNLLGVIVGYAELAATSLEEESQARADIAACVAAANTAAALVRQLLTYARRGPTEPVELDVNGRIGSIEPLLLRLLGEDMQFEFLPLPGPVVVDIDPAQFDQVIMNLAVNARDAMPAGGRLSVGTRIEQAGAPGLPADLAGGAYAVITVTDTGSGIDGETAKHIFEPFFTTKELGKGTGLGLASCEGIIARSGGHIGVTSELGKGTTFTIHLPLVTPAVAETTPEAAPPAGEASGEASAEPQATAEVVLLVEDHDDVRAAVERILTRAGFRVLSAENPLDALEIAPSAPEIKVVVTDIRMPVMDGVTLMEHLRPFIGHKPAVFISGQADEEVVDRALARRDAHFLPKPFASADLIAVVRRAIVEAQADG